MEGSHGQDLVRQGRPGVVSGTCRWPYANEAELASLWRQLASSVVTVTRVETAIEVHPNSPLALVAAEVRFQLNERTKQTERQSTQELLEYVSDAGFSWTAISSLLGVSIAETRKWHQGEPISSHDRNNLARFVAFCKIVTEEHPVEHVASWMEDTLDEHSYATGLDVYAAGQINELVQFAAGHIEAKEMLKRAGLDNNRSKEFEIFQAADGEKAVRLLAAGPS